MTGKVNVVDYSKEVGSNVYQGYTLEYNSYWVTVTKNERGTGRETQEVIFARNPNSDKWLDAAHERITKAILELDNAVLAAIKATEKPWLLLGHKMFVGGETLYFRDTTRGIGGASDPAKATPFTEYGAKLNMIPPYNKATGRGWEMVPVNGAKMLEVKE